MHAALASHPTRVQPTACNVYARTHAQVITLWVPYSGGSEEEAHALMSDMRSVWPLIGRINGGTRPHLPASVDDLNPPLPASLPRAAAEQVRAMWHDSAIAGVGCLVAWLRACRCMHVDSHFSSVGAYDAHARLARTVGRRQRRLVTRSIDLVIPYAPAQAMQVQVVEQTSNGGFCCGTALQVYLRLVALTRACWAGRPEERPPMSHVAGELRSLVAVLRTARLHAAQQQQSGAAGVAQGMGARAVQVAA